MRKLLIILAIVFQVLLLAYMAGNREYIYRNGKTVYLRTTPIDPRDHFRGDFVRLQYDINEIDSKYLRDGLAEMGGDWRLSKDNKVYVVLDVDDESIGNILYATDVKPEKGLCYICGRTNYKRNNNLNARFGIDSYFVEQGEGKELENRTRDGHRISLEMEIALSDSGTAVIKGHRISPLSIEVFDLVLKENIIKKAKVKLVNISQEPIAIVDLPGYASLKMEKSNWWWTDSHQWTWVNEEAVSPLPTDDDVHVLQSYEEYVLEIDFANPYWSIEVEGEGSATVAGYEYFDRMPFRIKYESPTRDACSGLSNKDYIWHGSISSQTLPNLD